MRARHTLAATPILVAASLTGCFFSDSSQGMLAPVGIQPTLSSIQENVFTPNCALSGCHAPPDPQLGQDLSAGHAYTSIVAVVSVEQPDLFRVVPGDPDGSYLYRKITGDPRILGDRMPLDRAPLTAEQIDAIRQWIENGAQDN